MPKNLAVQLNTIYEDLIAGSFPLGEKVDPDNTVTLLAQEVLHTSQVHTLTAIKDNTVFYFALKSRALASMRDFKTPLAAALPGNHNHAGDGIYLLTMMPYMFAVIKRDTQFRLLTGLAGDVRDAIANEGVPIIPVDEFPSSSLQSETLLHRALANRLSRITAAGSAAVIALSAITLIGSAITSGLALAGAGGKTETMAQQANELLKTTSLSQPLSNQIQRLTQLGTTAVEAGGWIDGYRFQTDKGESFQVSLPTWVMPNVIKSLALGKSEVTTEASSEPGMVWVTQKNNLGKAIAGLGSKDVPVVSAVASNPSAK